MKKKLLVPILSVVAMLGITVLVYGKEFKDNYQYPNGYKMEYYQKHTSTATGAHTSTENPAKAFAAIFIYDNDKSIVNSGFDEKDYYMELEVIGKGDYSVSYHSLKDYRGNPLGERRSLDSRYYPN